MIVIQFYLAKHDLLSLLEGGRKGRYFRVMPIYKALRDARRDNLCCLLFRSYLIIRGTPAFN